MLLFQHRTWGTTSAWQSLKKVGGKDSGHLVVTGLPSPSSHRLIVPHICLSCPGAFIIELFTIRPLLKVQSLQVCVLRPLYTRRRDAGRHFLSLSFSSQFFSTSSLPLTLSSELLDPWFGAPSIANPPPHLADLPTSDPWSLSWSGTFFRTVSD